MIAKTEEKQAKPDQGVEVTKLSEELKEEVLQKYTQIFTGLRRLEKTCHIEAADSAVTPGQSTPRSASAALHDRVKNN